MKQRILNALARALDSASANSTPYRGMRTAR